MSDDPYADRHRLTFEEEGAEPLPNQLQTKELSQRLRSRLWLVVYQSLKGDTHHPEMGGKPFFGER